METIKQTWRWEYMTLGHPMTIKHFPSLAEAKTDMTRGYQTETCWEEIEEDGVRKGALLARDSETNRWFDIGDRLYRVYDYAEPTVEEIRKYRDSRGLIIGFRLDCTGSVVPYRRAL